MNQYDLYKEEDKRIREWFKDHVPEILSFDNGNLLKIKWKKPGRWDYAIVYIIDQKMGYLCVCGDVGEAVYQWHPPISIDFIGGCDLSYFDGKCQASSCGERGKTWNEEVAVSYVESYIKEHIFDGDENSFYSDIYFDGYIEELLISKNSDLALLYTEEGYKHWKDLSEDQKSRFIGFAKEYFKDLIESGRWQNITKSDYLREFIEKQQKFEDVRPDAIEACQSEGSWHHWLADNGHEFFGDDFYEHGGIGQVISNRVQSHLIGLKMIREGLASGKFAMPTKVSRCPWHRFLGLLGIKHKT